MTATFVPRRRNDGTPYIDVTVTHSLTALDLAQLLASAHRTTDPAALPTLSYTKAVAVVRGELRARGGDAPFFWRDDFTDDDQGADGLEQWARNEITRIFPALGPSA
ncbi:hypothetical protein [Streptomyces noursei]|uniref:hypothetical protein n=1 Tax=Streptomyces noursei TaxID=1971 RepID=UPI00167660A6|nr:hypothetical protein [Streptomyces noursei]MCZ1021423.1 hypothetical protein [Streptomyces noursei]GGX46360.1 hypothetical protein GCM10010341_80100 [Streptomyces noursei]